MASLPSAAGSPICSVGHSSANTLNASDWLGSELDEYHVRPSWEQDIVPSADGAMTPELRGKRWALFTAGKMIYIAVVVSMLFQLSNVCFDDDYGSGGDDTHRRLKLEEPSKSTRSHTQRHVFGTLLYGLYVDSFFALCLSAIFRSPLDVMSLHKLLLEPLWRGQDKTIVCCSSPFLFGLLYLFCGRTSQDVSSYPSCEGHGGAGLGSYLTISGKSMMLVWFVFLGVSVVGLGFVLGLTTRCPPGCCAAVRKRANQYILPNGPFLDVFWKLQTVVWMYRAGGFELVLSIFLAVCSVLSVLLSVLGSASPDMLRRSLEDRTTTRLQQ